MELLIKVKDYDKYFNLLSESKLEKDWTFFMDAMSKNKELVDKFKLYMKLKNCGFLLKKYLSKFSCLEFQSNFEFQKVYYDILKFVTENYEFKNYFIKNLLINQIIKLAYMDKSGEHKQDLKTYLSENKCKDEWIEELLLIFKLYEALSIYYQINEKYEQALNIYKQHFPNEIENIEKLNDKIKELSSEISNDSQLN